MARFFIFLCFLSSSAFAGPTQEAYFKKFMAEFSRHPQATMSWLPPKYDSRNQRVSTSSFTVDQIVSSQYVEIKNQARAALLGQQIRPFAAFDGRNDVRKFFPSGTSIVNSINSISAELLQGQTQMSPWTGDYWPTYRAGLGARYQSESFPVSKNFQEYLSFYGSSYPINFEDSHIVDTLSPAEKYDILVGDENFSLTKWSWSEAEKLYRANKEVETWFGLCHGWAPASFMMTRPVRTIEIPVKNFAGKSFDLKFYPDDLKALATLLWANANTPSYFLGSRCYDKNPRRDESGRIVSPECFDTNPGAWHMALLTQVGQQQRSFVIDATYDYEVWNQPIQSYKYQYFNPQTQEFVSTAEQGLVAIENFDHDVFGKYRSPETRYVIGVSMELTYVIERSATHRSVDAEKDDVLQTVQYIYDLELKADGSIVGGEWYQTAHPDFAWAPPAGTRALSSGDALLQTAWEGEGAMPADWISAARTSSEGGQPLGSLVEVLLRKAGASR